MLIHYCTSRHAFARLVISVALQVQSQMKLILIFFSSGMHNPTEHQENSSVRVKFSDTSLISPCLVTQIYGTLRNTVLP